MVLIGSIVTFNGEPPSALEAPDVAKVVDLFRQQNEILRLALTTCVIVPEGTRLRSIHRKEVDENPNPMG